MSRDKKSPLSLRGALMTGVAFAGLSLAGLAPAQAQDNDVVIVTGTRIQSPNVVSSSPVQSGASIRTSISIPRAIASDAAGRNPMRPAHPIPFLSSA